MRTKIIAAFAYTGSALTVLLAICVPFYLIGAFSESVAHAGLHVDPTYSGGTLARTLVRNGYLIRVYQPVQPHLLQRMDPFVQIVFEPASALPNQVTEELDLDGDGQPDVRIHFAIPANAGARMQGDVVALNVKYVSLTGVSNDSFSRLLVRTGDKIVVRVPLNSSSKH